MKNPGLIDVQSFIPDILLDIRYAAPDNVFGEVLYPFAAAFLLEPAARKLAGAADESRKRGYRLRLYDAYRPLSVQRRLWALRPDSRYVAGPVKGSSHNRAAAVDVSLVRLDGGAVAMPSDFDDFSAKAAHGFSGTSPEAARNAALLRGIMEEAGFCSLREEWWHYSDPELRQSPLLDIPFESLINL